MQVKIGTFNLNNLFSRYNFRGEIDALHDNDSEIEATITFDLTDPERFRIREFRGSLVKAKSAAERAKIAERIIAMDVDVLAVQEVEDIDTLNRFARDDLDGLYRQRVLIEGNDPRLIDLGVLSRLPIGAVTSWQKKVHPEAPGETVFGRDLLQVEILNSTRKKRLFTIFNNHLKSHFVPFDEDPVEGAQRANMRRRRQAEMVKEIVEKETRPNSRYIVIGDMNDPPGSASLAPLVASPDLGLVNSLEDAEETRPAKADTPPPPSKSWTHRFKPSGQPARYELYDQIWLSPSLADRHQGAFIDRRTKHGGDGSDHDPAWVVLDL
jgi:endonuclease/exonuclease/phosphatase family metal-dependent hydrolase